MDDDKKPIRNKSEPKVHMIETFGEDMVGVISKDTSGLVQKIIHEQEERETQKNIYSPSSKQNRFFLFTSLLFIFLTLGLFVYSYFFHRDEVSIEKNNSVKSLILTDSTVFLDLSLLSKDEIATQISEQSIVTKIKKNQVEAMYFTENKKVIGFTRFNALVKSNFPFSKVPVVSENFMLGSGAFEIEQAVDLKLINQDAGIAEVDSVATIGNIYSEYDIDPLRYKPDQPTRKDLFMLLSVRSFEDAFPVFKRWEEKLLLDLGGIFTIDVRGSKNYLLTKDWEDGIVQNKNARILRDNAGTPVLFYVFVDNTHVVIAKTEEVVKEIIERLIAAKVKK